MPPPAPPRPHTPGPSTHAPPHRDARGEALEQGLQALADQLDGELHLDRLHRWLYATDASLYAEEPLGVVYPRHRDDLVTIVKAAARLSLPLIPRAAGTSLAGQCVGWGLVVDVSRHLTQIVQVDPDRRRVRVQPGVILDELNRALAPHRLMFGPDTSTSNRCMIGGMIGNNSSGSHSILYGNTLHHVLEVEAVLADGSVVRWGDDTPTDLAERARKDDREGRIYRALTDLVDAQRDEILARYPKPEVVRRNMGYALDFLANSERYDAAGPAWNLARFLCGSEGTLAFVTEATLNLVPTPTGTIVVAVHFDSLDASLRATVAALAHKPAAIELIDRRTLEATRGNLEQQRNRAWLQGDPAAVLVVEFFVHSGQGGGHGDTQAQLDAAVTGLIEDFQGRGLGYAFPVLRGGDSQRIWNLRKAGLGLLMGTAGDVKPVTLVEDTAVAVADLPEYVRRFAAILERHGTRCVYYAHASVGLLHLRPELNPKRLEDVETMKRIAVEVAELVREFRGTISGEHGDGRLRSPLIERMLGPEVTEALRTVKRTFDPEGILNPGKIVDPAPMDAQWRFTPGRPSPEVDTIFAYAEDDGLLRAVERCNGAGVCRKRVGAGGTMCPSYMATGDELHSTRGRANVFRTLLLGERPADAWDSHELYEALELCLSCKGCKSECPASVDMAKLKAEFLQHYYDRHGVPLDARVLGRPERGYALAQRFAGLANFGMRTPVAKALLSRLLGIDPRRHLPPFARQTLRQQLAGRAPLPSAGRTGEVVLFIDLFTDYNEPHLGLAAIDVLERAGYTVHTPPHRPSGRPQLSKGLLREARAYLEENVETFLPWAERGVPILGIEPSAVLTLVDEAPDLVAPALREAARTVAAQVDLVELFVGKGLVEGRFTLPFDATPRQVVLHGHCHQKSLLGMEPLRQALAAIPGLELQVVPSGCCGMAGSFGYAEKHYDLAMAIGEQVLFPAVRAASAEAVIAAPGTSCRHQLHDGTGRTAVHPIEVFHAALLPEPPNREVDP